MRLLLSVPAGGGGAASSVAGGQDPVLRRRYSLPPAAPPTLSRNHGSNGTHARRVTGRECPLISCVMRPV